MGLTFIIILLLPLLSYLLISLFGFYLGVNGSMFISVINIFITCIYAIALFVAVSSELNFYTYLWPWLSIADFSIDFIIKYDSLTAIMFIVVTLVSTCVHIYSCIYMYTDPYLSRFMAYLSLFSFFMLLLVSGGNLVVLFLGWEGVGLSSYLLISFWYTRVQAGKAATKAFLINKVGDLFLLSAISLILFNFFTTDFEILSFLTVYLSDTIVEIIVLLLFLGAVGKSAQIGLHTWLPDAMEGPTPVSALIHAATMVTAGVFLIIRCSYIFELAPRILIIIAIWGSITALFSGLIGAVQNDIKKIIAYSTCSQLGYMILGCGLSNYNLSLFHLFNHAFFKALLFLSAGSVIHLLNNEQDIRKMGGLAKLSPYIYINIIIASCALAGFPFLSGFYSKDLIIESSITLLWVNVEMVYWVAIVSTVLTSIYSIRLLDQVFWSDFLGFKAIIFKHTKITIIEIIILGILCFFSIFSGYCFKDLFSGLGSEFYFNSITIFPKNWILIEVEFLSGMIKILPFILSFLSFEIENKFFECKWFYNEIINSYLSIPVLMISRHYFEQYEKRILDYNGPFFYTSLIQRCYYTLNENSKNMNSLQTPQW